MKIGPIVVVVTSLAWSLLLAACVLPSVGDAVVRCAVGDVCPDDLRCVQGPVVGTCRPANAIRRAVLQQQAPHAWQSNRAMSPFYHSSITPPSLISSAMLRAAPDVAGNRSPARLGARFGDAAGIGIGGGDGAKPAWWHVELAGGPSTPQRPSL